MRRTTSFQDPDAPRWDLLEDRCSIELGAPSIQTVCHANRRTVLMSFAAAIVAACKMGDNVPRGHRSYEARLGELERVAGGRLGAYVYFPETGQGFGHRQTERFAHCSSFKMSLAAMILQRADKGEADLSQRLRWSERDLLPVSPITEAHTDTGLNLEELARATLITSDNTAANVLLKHLGGPHTLTKFWRELGDTVSQLDRYEPALNETPPGSQLDTTTPFAMALTTAALVHGDALKSDSRSKLRTWMNEVRTGTQRLRAGFPPDWFSGDKTGTGIGATRHTYVDIAFGGPPDRPPIIVTAYFEPLHLVDPMDPISLKVLAEVGRCAADSFEFSCGRSRPS